MLVKNPVGIVDCATSKRLPETVNVCIDGLSDLRHVLCEDVQDGACVIRDHVQFRSRTKFLRSSFLCVHVVSIDELSIISVEGPPYNDHKSQEQILGALFRLSYYCACYYIRRLPLWGENLWSLVEDVALLRSFLGLFLLFFRRFYALYFCLSLSQRLILTFLNFVVRLFASQERICFVVSCFARTTSISAYMRPWLPTDLRTK